MGKGQKKTLTLDQFVEQFAPAPKPPPPRIDFRNQHPSALDEEKQRVPFEEREIDWGRRTLVTQDGATPPGAGGPIEFSRGSKQQPLTASQGRRLDSSAPLERGREQPRSEGGGSGSGSGIGGPPADVTFTRGVKQQPTTDFSARKMIDPSASLERGVEQPRAESRPASDLTFARGVKQQPRNEGGESSLSRSYQESSISTEDWGDVRGVRSQQQPDPSISRSYQESSSLTTEDWGDVRGVRSQQQPDPSISRSYQDPLSSVSTEDWGDIRGRRAQQQQQPAFSGPRSYQDSYVSTEDWGDIRGRRAQQQQPTPSFSPSGERRREKRDSPFAVAPVPVSPPAVVSPAAEAESAVAPPVSAAPVACAEDSGWQTNVPVRRVRKVHRHEFVATASHPNCAQESERPAAKSRVHVVFGDAEDNDDESYDEEEGSEEEEDETKLQKSSPTFLSTPPPTPANTPVTGNPFLTPISSPSPRFPESEKMVEPKTVAEPIKSSEPYRPPTRTTEPATSSEPIKSSEPYRPPTRTTEPIKSSEPYRPPTRTTEPIKSSEPYRPPTRTTEPIKSSDPVKSSEPYRPPTRTTEPATSSEPIKSSEPYRPPTRTTEPVKPIEPAKSSTTEPVNPVEPSVKPVEPVKSAEPAVEKPKPVEPAIISLEALKELARLKNLERMSSGGFTTVTNIEFPIPLVEIPRDYSKEKEERIKYAIMDFVRDQSKKDLIDSVTEDGLVGIDYLVLVQMVLLKMFETSDEDTVFSFTAILVDLLLENKMNSLHVAVGIQMIVSQMEDLAPDFPLAEKYLKKVQMTMSERNILKFPLHYEENKTYNTLINYFLGTSEDFDASDPPLILSSMLLACYIKSNDILTADPEHEGVNSITLMSTFQPKLIEVFSKASISVQVRGLENCVEILRSLNYPKNQLEAVFYTLYDLHVIQEQSFFKWKETASSDPLLEKAVSQTTEFIDWLTYADYEYEE